MLTQLKNYYAFGMGYEGSWQINDGAKDNPYQYNGKELNLDHGLNWSDYGARWYDACVGRFMSVDPLAENYSSWSPYAYSINNPVRFTDPTGMSVEGDIYNQNGVHIGNDGKVDNKVYFKLTTDDNQMTQKEALNATDMASTTTGVSSTIDITASTGITHDEFVQFAANVYNEAKDISYNEKEKVASAINNRKDGHSLGGTWTETLDRIMSSKDSHADKMDNSRVDPGDNDILPGNEKVSCKKVRTGNYQNYINSSPTGRNTNGKMKDATKATIMGLSGPDKVNRATEWRGRVSYNKFGKEGSF